MVTLMARRPSLADHLWWLGQTWRFRQKSLLIDAHALVADLLPLACASLSDPVTSLPPPGLQLSELLAVIHVHAPLSQILVASIISFAHTPKYEAFNAQVEAYNAAVPLVRKKANFH